MSEKLSEKLHRAVLDAYAEAQTNKGSSRLLSELQLLIDDEVAALEQRGEGLERLIHDELDIDPDALELYLVTKAEGEVASV